MPYDVHALGQKIKVEEHLPRGFIDGALFINELLHGDLDIVNRHWHSHYKIKGAYPIYLYGQHPLLVPGQGLMLFRTGNQDYAVLYSDPSFREGVLQGAAWLGVNINNAVRFT